MATFYTNKVNLNAAGTNTVEARWLPTGPTEVIATCTLPTTTQLGAGDTIQICDIPAGVAIRSIAVDTDKLDGSGSATVTLSVGDGTSATRFLNAITTAQAGGYQGPNKAGTVGYSYTTTTRLLATVGTGAAAALSGAATIRFAISYVVDP